MTLNYNTILTTTPTNDPVLKVFLSQCLANPPKNLNADITLKFTIAAISWVGAYPQFSFTKQLPCPETSQLNQIFSIISKIRF
jgi:hypothetical protein